MVQALLLTAVVHGKDILPTDNARSAALAGVSVTLNGLWSVPGNPACITHVKSLTIAMVCKNHYQVPELGTACVLCIIPTNPGHFGLNYSTFGNQYYGESQASLLYAKSMGAWLHAGIGIHYIRISQPAGYGNLFAFLPSLGLQVIPHRRFIIGIAAFNPANQKLNPQSGVKIPAVLQAGIACKLGDETVVYVETEKKTSSKLRIYGGSEITFKDLITIRLGIAPGDQASYSLGIGLRFNKISIDVAVAKHQVLGFSPGLTISYSPK